MACTSIAIRSIKYFLFFYEEFFINPLKFYFPLLKYTTKKQKCENAWLIICSFFPHSIKMAAE